jgi:hypothetical protein
MKKATNRPHRFDAIAARYARDTAEDKRAAAREDAADRRAAREAAAFVALDELLADL